MVIEDYVSFETAKLLKEKGFDYYPDGSYWLIDANNVMYWVSKIGAYDYVENPTDSFQRPKNGYRLVTLQMAMKWLREVHHLYIDVGFGKDYKGEFLYMGDIYDLTKDSIHGKYKPIIEADDYLSDNPKTYEKAAEAAIKYCLENLI